MAVRRSPWNWKERLLLAVAVVLFFLFLGPLFENSHPLGSENVTVRLIAAVLLSALCSAVGTLLLGFMLGD
jgi:hypothetical protein